MSSGADGIGFRARRQACAFNPAWTAGFRGHSMKVRPRAVCGPRSAPSSTRRQALDGPVCRLPKHPPHRRFHPAVGTNASSNFLFGLGSVGPSRPRRCPRPSSTPATRPDANRASTRRVPCRDGRLAASRHSARSRVIHAQGNVICDVDPATSRRMSMWKRSMDAFRWRVAKDEHRRRRRKAGAVIDRGRTSQRAAKPPSLFTR